MLKRSHCGSLCGTVPLTYTTVRNSTGKVLLQECRVLVIDNVVVVDSIWQWHFLLLFLNELLVLVLFQGMLLLLFFFFHNRRNSRWFVTGE